MPTPVHMSQIQKTIPASFKGHVQLVGTELMTTNLTGTIGTDHFTGSGTGTVVGKQFEGGNVYLSNSKGTIQFSLGPAVIVKVRRIHKAAEVSCRRGRRQRKIRIRTSA